MHEYKAKSLVLWLSSEARPAHTSWERPDLFTETIYGSLYYVAT